MYLFFEIVMIPPQLTLIDDTDDTSVDDLTTIDESTTPVQSSSDKNDEDIGDEVQSASESDNGNLWFY